MRNCAWPETGCLLDGEDAGWGKQWVVVNSEHLSLRRPNTHKHTLTHFWSVITMIMCLFKQGLCFNPQLQHFSQLLEFRKNVEIFPLCFRGSLSRSHSTLTCSDPIYTFWFFFCLMHFSLVPFLSFSSSRIFLFVEHPQCFTATFLPSQSLSHLLTLKSYIMSQVH